jgi:hypothetical protein
MWSVFNSPKQNSQFRARLIEPNSHDKSTSFIGRRNILCTSSQIRKVFWTSNYSIARYICAPSYVRANAAIASSNTAQGVDVYVRFIALRHVTAMSSTERLKRFKNHEMILRIQPNRNTDIGVSVRQIQHTVPTTESEGTWTFIVSYR